MRIDGMRVSLPQTSFGGSQGQDNAISSDQTSLGDNAGAVDASQITSVPQTSEGDMKDAKEESDNNIMDKSINRANKSLANLNRRIERSVHEVTHAIMYVIRDTDTNEVISEFPPKKIEDMVAKMWELAGLVIDEKI